MILIETSRINAKTLGEVSLRVSLTIDEAISKSLTRIIHLHNADVVKKFIFRYLSVPLNNGYWNIFMDVTNKDVPDKSSS
jgi:hypothetical protein